MRRSLVAGARGTTPPGLGLSLQGWLEPAGGDLSAAQEQDAWLGIDPLAPEPISIVDRWLREAFADANQRNPHAVALATVDADGNPSVRMVLCNRIGVERGTFTMYTNRESRKARALKENPRAAIVFHWKGRQARIEGRVSWVSDEESDAYFASRPLEARLGAWASRQSEPIDSRASLLAGLEEVRKRFNASREEDRVPRPPYWGGIELLAASVELWVDRVGRIHDRAVWSRATPDAPWTVTRLQP